MEIATERLLLRDFVADDWAAVLAYQQKPDYLRYYAWTERTPEAVRQFVAVFLSQQHQTPRFKFQLAVTLKADGRLIGNCGVRRETVDAQRAEIGYELDPAYWRQGYATEAASALLAYGFTQMPVHRITAHCIADNQASAHVLEKIGMQQEGRLREHEYFKGRWWDTLLYGILADEWRARHHIGEAHA